MAVVEAVVVARPISPFMNLVCMLTRPRYNGPLEYLTMWMCLFLSPAACERLQEWQVQDPNWSLLRSLSVVKGTDTDEIVLVRRHSELVSWSTSD